MWGGVHFDSDQAVVGLMAKHLAQGRAFPLFFYGQTYMLGVEAWAAAPVIALAGTSVAALKLPLFFVNVAIVILLTRAVTVALDLRPLVAAMAALPLALPAAGVGARLMEANGGNVEPLLYVVLLWAVRERPWPFGLILGFGVLHREFTAYAAAAMLVLHALEGRLWSRTGLQHWALVAIGATAMTTLVHALKPFASVFGPGSSGDTGQFAQSSLEAVSTRLCFAPALWPARVEAVLFEHLPMLYGGATAPVAALGVRSEAMAGRPPVMFVVLTIVFVGVASGVWTALRRGSRSGGKSSRSHEQLGWYLLLVGLASTGVYTLASCANIGVLSLRYNLLALMIPVGALVLAMGVRNNAALRGLMAVAVTLWGGANLSDIVAVTREYQHAEPADVRQIAADVLVARGVPVAWSDFRMAYHITFLADERVRVAALDSSRIYEYALAAQRPGTPTIAHGSCPGGGEIAFGIYLCPP